MTVRGDGRDTVSRMDVATLVDAIGNLAAVVAAVGVLVVNAKLDKVIGRVDEQGKTLTTHVNAPGLHR